MRCAKCGAQNDDINDSCVNCGNPLAYARPQGSDVFSRMVPYKNSRALIAYYLTICPSYILWSCCNYLRSGSVLYHACARPLIAFPFYHTWSQPVNSDR